VFSPQAIRYLQFVGRGSLEYIRGSWITSTKENTGSGLQGSGGTVRDGGSPKKKKKKRNK